MMRLCLAACLAAAPALAQEVEILPGFSDFRLPETLDYDLPMQVVADWVAGYPDEGGRPALTLTGNYTEEDDLVIEITETGLGDDAVFAVQQRYVFDRSDTSTWVLIAYGHRQQCARGVSPGTWTANTCP